MAERFRNLFIAQCGHLARQGWVRLGQPGDD
jgi:hypothetical protein